MYTYVYTYMYEYVYTHTCIHTHTGAMCPCLDVCLQTLRDVCHESLRSVCHELAYTRQYTRQIAYLMFTNE